MSRATIREAIRAWLIGAGATAVIFADQGALRPALPYLTVKVRLHDIPHGGDAIHYRDDDTLLALGERAILPEQAPYAHSHQELILSFA